MSTNEKRHLLKENPHIMDYFIAHCLEGNSPFSFTGKLKYGSKAYYWLIKNNKEFVKTRDVYSKKPLTYYTKYSKAGDAQK